MKKRHIALLVAGIFLIAGCGVKKQAIVASPVKNMAGISMAAIATHNVLEDCWVVVNNNIYNVSDYLGAHPGGEKNITDYCGQDATSAFETRPAGSGTPHSDRAREIMAKYYIGDLAK